RRRLQRAPARRSSDLRERGGGADTERGLADPAFLVDHRGDLHCAPLLISIAGSRLVDQCAPAVVFAARRAGRSCHGRPQRSRTSSACVPPPTCPRMSCSVLRAVPMPFGPRTVRAASPIHSPSGGRWAWTVSSELMNHHRVMSSSLEAPLP